MNGTLGKIRIGTSGWVYKHWQGPFYPPGRHGDQFLSYYAERFPTVEINYSFYKLPTRENFAVWRQQTPSNFVFAVKASRFLTHLKKLHEPEAPLGRFFDLLEVLGPQLGPILFQLPPHWRKNLPRLVSFLEHLPSDHRYAFEFRDPSWQGEDVYLALSAYGAALVISDYRTMPLVTALTTEFAYIRLHGGQQGPGYTARELEIWADRVHHYLREGLDVYVYFNNDVDAAAPRDATTLTKLVEDRQTNLGAA